LAPGDGFGGSVRGIDDVDGDGRPDVIVGTLGTVPAIGGYVRVFSGASGALLHEFTGSADGDLFGVDAAAIGDVNADGHVDFAVGAIGDGNDYLHPGFPPFVPPFWTDDDVGAVVVLSGFDGQVLYRVLGRTEFDGFGYSVDAVGDVDGDGIVDFVAGTMSIELTGAPGYARLVSGVDGSTIHTFLRGASVGYRMISARGAGDVDADGVPDVVIGATPLGPGPHVFVFSGSSSRPIFRYVANQPPTPTRITVDGATDVDHDGTSDYLIGVSQPALGAGFADLFVSP
jgi:hypothetical protein